MNSTGNLRKQKHSWRHDDDGDDDYFSNSRYYPRHEGNSSITASVTIHVTPDHYELTNWALLWAGFLVVIAFTVYQVILENKWIRARKQEEQQAPNHRAEGEGNVPGADWTRIRFRRLLLAALSTRCVMIPVQLWSNPLWAQFLADTLPSMVFASAWTLLASFFVQVVGVAMGTGTDASPGLVMQITAYMLYMVVMGTYFWNPLASVLLYALLCCVYAALFGTTLYFCPRVLILLRSTFSEHFAVAIRLAISSVVCVLVLGFRTVGFARKVVAPPKNVSWWWQYGMLELIPAAILLLMMQPRSLAPAASPADSGDEGSKDRQRARSSSPGSGSGTPPTPMGRHVVGRPGGLDDSSFQRDTAPLLKPGVMYGAT